MKRRSGTGLILKATLVTVLLFLARTESAAQANLAAVRGTVVGQSGTPVSQAAVVAKHGQSGQVRRTQSNRIGEFEIRELAPGSYEIEVSDHDWFQPARTSLSLEAGQVASLEFRLEPAAATQTQPAPAPASGERAQASGSAAKVEMISETQLVGLPLNGRSYVQLATLQAGVSDPSAASGSRGVGGGSLNVSGGRNSSNTFLMDGTNVMDTGNRAPRSAAGVQLGSDAVLQVMVFSTNYSAEYGRGSGGILNSITRSGTNEFHGNFFEYLRNSKVDARSWTDREKPPFKRNQFGFTLTGPVRKGKTYFMGSFEAMRDRLNESQLDTFIDADARRGDITNLDGSINRVIPPELLSPAVKPYLALIPLPNGQRLGGGFAQHVASQYLPTDENFFAVRVDHQITDRDSMFVRYTFDDATATRAGGIFAFGSLVQSRSQYLTLVGSHIFSPSLLLSLRGGYTRPVDATESTSEIEIPRNLFFVKDAPQFGQIQVPGAVGFGPGVNSPEANKMNSFQFSGDVIAQRRAHGLKFGVEIHRYRWDMFSSHNKGGSWSFNSLDSFLQGGPEGTSLTVAVPGSDNSKAFRQTLLGLYVQDEYKVRANLQLSLGLRYEFMTLVQDRLGRTSYLDDYWSNSQVTVGPPLAHNPSSRNFSPRLGVAWSPGASRETSVNAGVGIYYDHLLGYAMDSQKTGLPFYRVAIRPNFDARRSFPDAVAAASEALAALPLQTITLDYRNLTSPRVLRYDFSVQRRLPGPSSVQVSYVGARGNHLFRNSEVNLFPFPIVRGDGSLCFPPDAATVRPQDVRPSCPAVSSDRAGVINPAFRGGINMMSSDAQSFYNSFLLTADTRPSRAMTLRLSFTYSKSIDDASSIGTGASAQQYGLDRTLDRGRSDYDNRKRLSMSYFYNLPAAKNQASVLSSALSQLFGGWRLGGIFSFRTSTPATVRINVRTTGYLFAAARPNLVPGQSTNPISGASIGCKNPNGETFIEAGRKIKGPELFFDPCVFTLPDPGTIGDVGRTTVHGPSIVTMDLSLQREFSLGNDRRLQFRSEFFNLANHTNFRTPIASSMVVFTGGGRYNPGVGRFVNLSTTSRQIQFALRLSF